MESDMPVGGFVININPDADEEIFPFLAGISGLEVHGHDELGNVVAVIDAKSSEIMQKIIKKINSHAAVLTVGLTYLNVEDEAESLAPGEKVTGLFHGDQLESSQQ